MHKIKKISLIGLGAMGSFFAPKLYEAYGNNFRVIAGGARKERLETNGVIINGTKYNFHLIDPEETGDPADLIIIATKGYSLEQAIADIANQVGEHTQIMAVMNGIEAEDKLIAAYGSQRVLYSLMRVSIEMKGNTVDYDPRLGVVFFGERNGNVCDHYTERVCAVKEVMDTAGITYRISSDMEKAIWYKYACNVSENLSCALLGISFGWFVGNENANRIRHALFREVMALAAAKGVSITEEDLAKQDGVMATLPPANVPSTLQDLRNGKHTEIDLFAGTAIRLGKESGISTPYCCFVYDAIKILERKNDLRTAGKNEWNFA